MKRKNIAVIFIVILTVSMCMASPLFASEILNRMKTGKTYTVQKEAGKTESLAKKINIYRNVERETVGQDVMYGSKFQKENSERYEAVKNELLEFQRMGIMSVDEAYYGDEATWEYGINTFVNEEGDYITVWNILAGGYDELEIEASSGKIISVCLQNLNIEYVQRNMELIAEELGAYLGMEEMETKEEVEAGRIPGEGEAIYIRYTDREGTEVWYDMGIKGDMFYFVPTVEGEVTEAKELDRI